MSMPGMSSAICPLLTRKHRASGYWLRTYSAVSAAAVITSSAATSMPASVSSPAICLRVRVVVLVRYDRAIWLSASTRSVSAAPSMGCHEVTKTPSMSNSTPPTAMVRQ